MPIVKCKCCDKEFNARQADINRGWGKFCSKSCKAKKQAKRLRRNRVVIHRENRVHQDYEYDPSDDEYWNGKDY